MNERRACVMVVVALVVPLAMVGCGGESGGAGETSPPAVAGPLDGQWVVDVETTVSYHGGFGLTDEERATFEGASFAFGGGKLTYSMGEKSGEIAYEVESATDTAVVLKTAEGKTLRFQLRPDGKAILPEHRDWLIAVIEKK